MTIFIGCLVAVFASFVTSFALQLSNLDLLYYRRYIAPIIEEMLKASYVAYLVRSKKIGFMVDAAIFGFAIGAGFAFIENIYYLQNYTTANLLVWMIRGLGTAVMHSGTTAIFGIFTKNLSDRSEALKIKDLLPGLGIAIVLHSVYNHFFLNPVVSTVLILASLPLVMVIVFQQSEKATRNWLGASLDTDIQLLNMITTGNISQTKIGSYLQSLRERFTWEVVADMLCLIRIHVELSLAAKGFLLMREAGFRIAPDQDIKSKFDELKFLEKNIGKTGYLAISPFLRTSSRDLWQLYMLGKR